MMKKRDLKADLELFNKATPGPWEFGPIYAGTIAGELDEENVKPSVCNRGFHFCKQAKDCFNYYIFDPNNKVAEVIALGEVAEEGDIVERGEDGALTRQIDRSPNPLDFGVECVPCSNKSEVGGIYKVYGTGFGLKWER